MASILSLKEATNYFQKYLSNPQIAKMLSVTADQVYKYGTGYTRSCSDTVVDAFYDNFVIKGEPVLIDFFPDVLIYLELREMRTNSIT